MSRPVVVIPMLLIIVYLLLRGRYIVSKIRMSPNNNHYLTVDAISITFRRDIEYHRILLQSLLRYNLVRHIVTVVPAEDMHFFVSRFASLSPRLLFKESIYPKVRFCDAVSSDYYTDADIIMHFDSDMILARNLTIEDIVKVESEPRVKLYCGPYMDKGIENGNKPSIDFSIGMFR